MTIEATLTDFRPHMVNAMYQWLSENRLTPYITASTRFPGTVLPNAFLKEPEITLNISMAATQSLQLTGDAIRFVTRFQGEPASVRIPYQALKRIFAKENPSIFAGYENKPVEQKYEQENPPSNLRRPKLHLVK